MGCELSKQLKPKKPKYKVLKKDKETFGADFRETKVTTNITETDISNTAVVRKQTKSIDVLVFGPSAGTANESNVSVPPLNDSPLNICPTETILGPPQPDHIIEPSSHNPHTDIKKGMFDADVLEALMDVDIATNVREDMEYRAILEQLK